MRYGAQSWVKNVALFLTIKRIGRIGFAQIPQTDVRSWLMIRKLGTTTTATTTTNAIATDTATTTTTTTTITMTHVLLCTV